MSPSDVPAPVRVPIHRTHRVPDRLRLMRFRKAPEYGPRVLFFSGGTALNPLSRALVEYTHNSIHLTTPFDSGGSSGKLRGAFDVPGVGDLRSRLMALADRSVRGQSDIFNLFAHRLSQKASAEELRRRLEAMIDGNDPLVSAIMDPMRKLIRNHLRHFYEGMPADFDLRGASIGNLVLVGGYLNNRHEIDPVVFLFSRLVEVKGTVVPTVTGDLHLAARLGDGNLVVGQHRMAGKEYPPIGSPIRELFLVKDLEAKTPCRVSIDERVRRLIGQADLICFPMGSFFSSVVANLLPAGVGAAVAANPCPKVYIPNTGTDPEQFGHSVADCAAILVRTLAADCGAKAKVDTLLTHVLVDSRTSAYAAAVDMEAIQSLGLYVIDAPLVTDESEPNLDEDRLLSVLLSMS
ncbi:MAG: GAK system CofD-like protein [Phycisphaerae bacterium]|nr:GAK system CofD-like protein [Phycisphaerae bacterium]